MSTLFEHNDNTFTWLSTLLLELNETTDYLEPRQEIGSNDHVVGDMNELMKKLYTVYMSMAKQASMLKVELGFSDNEETRLQAFRLIDRATILQKLFWLIVKDVFNLWDKESTGVRAGFKVVWSDSSPTMTLKDLFGNMFGI